MIPVILFFFGDAFNERAVAVAIFFCSIFGNNEWTVSRRNMCQTRYVYIFSVPFTTRYLCVCVLCVFFVVVDELRDREYEVTNTVTTLNKHKQWHVCYIKKNAITYRAFCKMTIQNVCSLKNKVKKSVKFIVFVEIAWIVDEYFHLWACSFFIEMW